RSSGEGPPSACPPPMWPTGGGKAARLGQTPPLRIGRSQVTPGPRKPTTGLSSGISAQDSTNGWSIRFSPTQPLLLARPFLCLSVREASSSLAFSIALEASTNQRPVARPVLA